jgi:serine/threonine protein kinase
MLGLDPIPYNHGLRLALNSKNTTIASLMKKNITTLSIQPILVSEKPSFENIELKHFQLLKHLGSGGFSTVYLAKCEIDQRVCALKFIKKDSITSAKKAKML